LAGWQSQKIDETPPSVPKNRLKQVKRDFNGDDIQALQSHQKNSPKRPKPTTQILIQDVFPEPSTPHQKPHLFAPYQKASHGQLIAETYQALTPKGSTRFIAGRFLNPTAQEYKRLQKDLPTYTPGHTYADTQAQTLAKAVDEDRLLTQYQIEAALQQDPKTPLIVNQSYTIDSSQGALGFLKKLHAPIIRKEADWRALKKDFPLGIFSSNQQADAKWYRDVYQHPDMKAARLRYQTFLRNLPPHVLLVRANGNEGSSDSKTPSSFRLSAGGLDLAREKNVLVVGAGADPREAKSQWIPSQNDDNHRTARKGVLDFSTRGQYPPNVTADGMFFLPGKSLNTTNQTAELVSGTSFATPTVGALAATLWDKNPRLSAEDVKQAIVKHARPSIGGKAIDEGAGRIDVAQTLKT
jgi:hypothetical protein